MVKIHLRRERSFVWGSVPIGAKGSCGWEQDSCFYINALKQDGYPGQETYRKLQILPKRQYQVSYDGFKSPGSQNQRCRSEKYLLKRLSKQRKYIFGLLVLKKRTADRLQWMMTEDREQFVRLLSGRNDAIAP